jgi:UDP-glucuronate 4-epimerase
LTQTITFEGMKILITGVAGFIGFYAAKQLAERGEEVIAIDNINDYYPVSLKYDRLGELGIESDTFYHNDPIISTKYPKLKFIKMELRDAGELMHLFDKEGITHVCHLAAQAGVRYSLKNPQAYMESNMVGFLNLLEAVRHNPVEHFVYASSSSVYAMNKEVPFSTSHKVSNPISLYAATKRSNELMAHVYSHLYDTPTTGLRFFTVYGPWGRPDMAPMLFAKAILEGKPIKVFNNGEMERDFTFIDDIVEGVIKVLDKHVSSADQADGIPYNIYNIGNNAPVKLMDFISTLEKALGKSAEKIMMPMQPGDVHQTYADVSELIRDYDFKPSTSIENGVQKFANWFKSYNGY